MVTPSTQIIAFYRGRKYAKSWFLAWWQRSEFSHCETILGRTGDVYEVAGSTLFVGVRTTQIKMAPEDWECIAIPRDRDDALFWMLEHRGERYGLRGLAGFIFRRIKGPKNQWWCSKACAAMAKFPDPWRFDVATLRATCFAMGGYTVELP